MLAIIAVLFLAPGLDAPKLTIVISIDQFRADYLTRFDDLYIPATSSAGVGGFRWLAETGTRFVNAKYSHVPTETGPGHAVIGTGSSPAFTGIVGNEWYDRKLGRQIYCVEDAASKDVVTGKPSYSARNLQVTTIGDELERATNGQSKTISIALKDRSSILMAGHIADDVIWFDGKGSWTTSDYYAKNGKLPGWVASINNKKIPDGYRGKSWTQTLAQSAYLRTSIPDKPNASSFGSKFPHVLADDDRFYGNWTKTPWANEWVLSTAESAITAAGLGQDAIPDLLTISLSSNDYLGHAFGPDSPEVLQMSVALDGRLSEFFRFVERNVPGGLKNVLIVVTADHGVMPAAEEFVKRGLPGGRVNAAQMLSGIKKRLDDKGAPPGVIKNFSDMIYLDDSLEPGKREDAAMLIRDYLRGLPEVYTAFTRKELEEKRILDEPVSKMLASSFNRQNSGDVFFFMKPGYILDSFGAGTSHGSPWPYDTDVPLLMRGRWLAPGVRLEEAGPKDIAPTLSAILGISKPSGVTGRTIGLR